MLKLIKSCSVGLGALLIMLGVAGTLAVPTMAEEADVTKPVTTSAETNAEVDKPATVPPTFKVELDESNEAVELWAGKNLLIAGNNMTSNATAATGMMLVAGNVLNLNVTAEYGLVFGNVIDFNGRTSRDLYIAGNVVTLKADAELGRDVFVASSSLAVETDLAGDLAVTAETVVLKDIEVRGNVNINAARVQFDGDVKIAGALTYNDDASVSGLDRVSYGSIEAYHVDTPDAAALIVAEVYGKFISIAGLFVVMALIAAFYPKVHDKLANEANVNSFGADLAIGLGTLIIIPAVALLSFFTVVAAPLGVIAIVLYLVMIYLAQGFAGAWLGHILLTKLMKGKSNVFAEIFVGVLILGLLALIPFVGVATGFIGMLLGLGLIVKCIKPCKAAKVTAKAE